MQIPGHPSYPRFILIFGKEWTDQIEILRVGNSVSAIGKVHKVDVSGVTLNECELVETSAANS